MAVLEKGRCKVLSMQKVFLSATCGWCKGGVVEYVTKLSKIGYLDGKPLNFRPKTEN